MTTTTREGGRTVQLLRPFKWKGRSYRTISFAPVRLDQAIKFQEGKYDTALELAAELAGMKPDCLRQLSYPDADLVLRAFVDMLPDHMQQGIASAQVPLLPGFKRAPEPEAEAEPSEPAPFPWADSMAPEAAEPEAEPEPEVEYRESEDGEPTIPLDAPGFGPPKKQGDVPAEEGVDLGI